MSLTDWFAYFAFAVFLTAFIAFMIYAFKRQKKESAENLANMRQYLLLQPKDIIESSIIAMRDDRKQDYFVKKVKEEAARLDAENFLDVMRAIKEISIDANYLVYCKGRLPVILKELKNGNYELEELGLAYEKITTEEIEKAIGWLQENYDYKSEGSEEEEEDDLKEDG